MAYDEELADRLRTRLAGEDGGSEKRMFGGLAFLIDGHMAVAASGQGGLLVRVDPAQTPDLVTEPGVRRLEMRGRGMDGWLQVEVGAVQDDADLDRWVRLGIRFVRTLPPK